MRKAERTQKAKKLARFVEIMVLKGEDITPIMGRPLKEFDFEAIEKKIAQYEAQNSIN